MTKSGAETQRGSAWPQSTRTSISCLHPARSGGLLASTLFASSEFLKHGLDSFDSICRGLIRPLSRLDQPASHICLWRDRPLAGATVSKTEVGLTPYMSVRLALPPPPGENLAEGAWLLPR